MWTLNDLNWLAEYYPDLKDVKSREIEGNLHFRMLRTGGQYLVNPPEELILSTTPADYLLISDTYKIRITWTAGEPYPSAHEIGGKRTKTAKRLGKSLLDMHQYEQNGALCLAATMDMERTFRSGFKLDVFVEELLIPYLFAQSHYDKTQIWLWGELSHGYLGLLEWLGRQEQPDDRDIGSTYKSLTGQLGKGGANKLLAQRWRGHYQCLCQSGKKTRDCHPEVQNAISLLRDAISRGLKLLSG